MTCPTRARGVLPSAGSPPWPCPSGLCREIRPPSFPPFGCAGRWKPLVNVVRLPWRAFREREEGCSATCAVTPMSVGSAILVAHDEAAVDVDRLARHVIGVATREKAHDARHVLGSLRPAEGDHRGSPLPGFTGLPALEFAPFGVDLFPHRRVDRARADAIRRNPMGRQRLRRGA